MSNPTIDRNSIPHLESANTLESDVSRRSFLSTASTAVAAAGAVQFSAKSNARILGSNDCIGVSVIGDGVIGMTHFGVIKKLKESNNLVPIAVADCWKTRADAGKESIGALESHADYRRVLDSKYRDYVFIGTPEHWHGWSRRGEHGQRKLAYQPNDGLGRGE